MQFYSAPQAAAIVGKHPKTVTDALRSGELRGYQRSKGAHWIVEDVDLRAWVTGGGA